MKVVKLPLVIPMVLVLLVIGTESRNRKFWKLNRVIRQDYEKEGRPGLHNCALEKQQSVATPVPINFQLVIAPRWTNYTEFYKDPSILNKFRWSYKLVRVTEESGKATEESLDIERFKSKGECCLAIAPYSLPPGYYKVYPSATLINPADRLLPMLVKVCHLMVVGLKPIPLITGGTYRMVPSNTPIVLNGSESLDPNNPSRDNSELKYRWSCSQKLKQTFCKKDPISTRSVFVVPQRYVVAGDRFEITLRISSALNTKAESRQEIEIVKNGALLEIRCQKNCPPAAEQSNINSITFLQVRCLKNCKGVKSGDFAWSVNATTGLDFNYEDDTQFGNKGEKFVINSKVLKPGEYQVTVRLNKKKGTGQAMTTLIFEQPPKVDSCSLLPQQGESLKMHFHLQCKQELSFRPHYYELYSMEKNQSVTEGQLITDGFFPDVFNKFFMLPSSQDRTFVVRVTIDNGPHTLVPLQARITSSVSQKPTEERLKVFTKIYEESVSGKMRSPLQEEREIALQTFQALINEITDVKNEDRRFVADFKSRVLSDLFKVPLLSVTQMVTATGALTKLLNYEDRKSDPVLAKSGTSFCKKVGQRYVDVVREERFPLTCGDANRRMASTLSECFAANTDPNYPLLDPLPVDVMTETPILLEPVIFEDYPEYRDFSDKYYKDIENLQEATANIFEGNQAAAKAIALGAVVGEKSIVQKGTNSEIMVTKDEARFLSQMLLRSNGVTLQPSKDLSDGHPIDVFLMTWSKNILWWNTNGTKPISNIVNIEFWHSTCKERITRFNRPANVFFEMKRKEFKPEVLQDVIRIPEGYHNLKHHQLNRHIYVRRVALPHHRVLLVEFHNLSVVLDSVITIYKFPTIEDFIPGKTINSKTNFISWSNTRRYDVWAYIGILPRKGSISDNSELRIAISVLSTCCILWLPSKNQWIPSCSPGDENNSTMIHCKCKSFSTYAGHIQNVKSARLELLSEEVELDLRRNLVIFLTVASVFFTYCLLLLLTFCKRKQKAMVYFLADNLGKHRYAYLVMVKTGKKGTTSNVTVKLNGTRDATPAHVLNYPDPKRLLLQKRGKDVFVVTNEHHLGEISEMELWVDCSGARPSWFCEEIIIYDLQWKKSWYFQIRRSFSPAKGNVFVKLTPNERDSRRVVNVVRRVTVWNFWHTWCLWAHEKNLSYVERLTVVFSTILMIFAVVLMVQGVPEMELRDVLDLETYNFEINSSIIASLVAFVFHIAITWLFRLSTPTVDTEENGGVRSNVSRICWRVLIIAISASATFLIIWGFWVPYNKSLVWLTSSVLALSIDVILYENIVIILISLFYQFEQVEYVGDQFEQVLMAIHQQRRFLMRQFGGFLLRPLVEQYHTPLEKMQLKKQRIHDKIRQKLASEFMDLIMFGVYIVILYVVILLNKDSFAVISKNEILSMIEGEHTRTLAFSSIRTMDEIYEYINRTLISVIQPMFWYKNLSIASPGMTIDFSNKYIGVARFRQLRIPTDFCEIPHHLQFLNLSVCRPELTIFNTETKSFGHGWGNITSVLFLDRLRSIWQYMGEGKTETLPYIGEFAYYPGGGYVAFLGRTLHNSVVNFRIILSKMWIDHNTRGFFIEFLTYNANYNMFNAVRLLFEQSTTGYGATKIEIYSARMIFVQNEIEETTIVFFGLFVVWVLLLFLQRSVRIVRNFRDFYRKFWFWIDLTIIILSITCIVTYFVRLKMVGRCLDAIESSRHNEFIGYFNLFYIEDFLTACAAFLILISTARLWRFLRFGLFFRIMERTLSSGAFALWSISLAFFVLLTAYGLGGVLMFGNEFSELSSFVQVVTTLVLLSLRPDSFELTRYTRNLLDYWYFSSYLVLMQIILFVYVIIVIMAYMSAQLEFSREAPTYNLRSFIQEQLQSFPLFLRRKYNKMRGGEERSFLRPKRDEFRYANCLSTQKKTLRLMECVTKSQIRSMGTNNENSDVDLMLEVCKIFCEEDEIEIFFKGHFAGEGIRMIDEKRVTKIADFVQLLFKKKPRSPSKMIKVKDSEEESNKIIRSNQDTLERCNFNLMLIYCNLERLVLNLDL